MVQIFSDLANFSGLEGNLVASRPEKDSERLGNILPQIVHDSRVQKCMKS